jgi:putative exporter of polyketide antibiotics
MEYNYNQNNNLQQPNTLVFGILGLILGSIFGIIFGAIGKKKANEFIAQGGTLAGASKVGFILSKLAFIFGIIGVVVYAIIIIACIASSDFRDAFLSAYGF